MSEELLAVKPKQELANFNEKDARIMVEALARYFAVALPVAISQTNENDWTDHGKALYCHASGTAKINRIFKITIDSEIDIEEKEVMFHGEKETIFIFRSKATMPAILDRNGNETYPEYSIPCKSVYNPKDDNTYMKTAADLWKKAETQLLRDGVVKILGLEGYKAEDLKAMGKTVQRVQYEKGAKGGKRSDQQDLSEKEMEIRGKISASLLDLSESDVEAAADKLEKMTSFEGKNGPVKGKRSTKDLSKKQIPVVWGKIKEAYGKDLAAMGWTLD